MEEKRRVYLDNAATTPLAPEVVEAMLPVMKSQFGNPSSSHGYGREVRAQIELARKQVASLIGALPAEITFTSGGTEADNMAIQCAVRDLGVTHIITSPIEHHAVLHTVECVAKEHPELGYSLVSITPEGYVDEAHLKSLLEQHKDETLLVSLMHANNEIGNSIDLQRISDLCHEYNAFFHSDTVQTMGHIPIDLSKTHVDFVTGAAHKFHGPKGVGFLYTNRRVKLQPFINGGSQERNKRGGTENVYGIVGLAKALSLAIENESEHHHHLFELKQHMAQALQKALPSTTFNGDPLNERNLVTVLSVRLPETEKAGLLLFNLDLHGIAASGGSACSSGAAKGSHVMQVIHGEETSMRPNVRFSFSRYTTKDDVEYAVDKLKAFYNH